MFSGIHSLIFGKKHKHKQDDSAEDKSIDNDFEVLERRHSDEFDKNSMYPKLDPSQSNLPYAISPSLPNLKEATSDSPKEETKVDMLQGVPFVMSSQLLLLENNESQSIKSIGSRLNKIKSKDDDELFEDFTYDYELEHTVSSEFSES